MELIGEQLKGILVCIGGRSGIRQSKTVGGLFTMVGYPPFGDPVLILDCICRRSPPIPHLGDSFDVRHPGKS